MTTNSDFERFVRERFGVLSAGAHEQDEGAACVLEAAAAWRGLEWTDEPEAGVGGESQPKFWGAERITAHLTVCLSL